MATATAFDDGARVTGISSPSSAVSWPAIFAGAAAAAALSLILLVLGTGLGLAVVSPWAGEGVSAEAMSWSTILWIVFVAVASSGLGGYLAGRLRTRWLAVHSDEVYFRDTAHGFLAWAVATLATAAVLTSAVGLLVGAGVAGGAAAATTAGTGMVAAAASADEPKSGDNDQGGIAYAVDSLFRSPAMPSQPTTGTGAPAAGQSNTGNTPLTTSGNSSTDRTGEMSRIFANALATGPLSSEDSQYAAQVVSEATGLPLPEAERRVTEVYAAAQAKLADARTKAMEAADVARKNAAYASLWIFVSLLSGAFVASLMATIGGRRRDLY